MENLNRLMNAQIMGHSDFSKFYAGLRQIEKQKTRDAKLAKDTGGASKAVKRTKQLEKDNFVFDANRDLEMGTINAEEFLCRMTSKFTKFCEKIDACPVASLDYYEIDEQPILAPVNNDLRLCQLCANSEAIVTLECGCQLLCLKCFREYANTFTVNGRRKIKEDGNPVVDQEMPLKCPHCQNSVTYYIVARR